jgi:HTH-type transcriptional regulator/antitoxin HigA|tara:strand:- start:9667 stop:9891 length:225 start_codon:yes stop_codon:yes gene_type:complete
MIKPILNHEDYQEALSQVETLWGADQDTPNGDQLDILLVLIEAYETKNYPMPHLIQLTSFTTQQIKHRTGSTCF